MWEIIGVSSRLKRKMYKVKCQCGYVGFRRKDHVHSGRSTKCRSCVSRSNKTLISNLHKYRPTATLAGELDKTRFSRIRIGAERRNLEFSVSMDFIWELFLSQDRKCKITGLLLAFSDASLDRIDSSKGYTESNVQWVHKKINTMKWDMTLEDFVDWCELVVKHNR